jgi:hypothetical protein
MYFDKVLVSAFIFFIPSLNRFLVSVCQYVFRTQRRVHEGEQFPRRMVLRNQGADVTNSWNRIVLY